MQKNGNAICSECGFVQVSAWDADEVMRQLTQITEGTELADMLNGVAAAMIKHKIEALPTPMGILACADCRF